MCDPEELEDVAAFDAAIAANEETHPLEKVASELGLDQSKL
jgi:hypothetical protein